MTCVVSSPWQPPFSSTYGWASMNFGDNTPTTSVVDRNQYGYASSESESRQASSSSGKKRASRAGTRSVSTLSTAQLERKRANDREAQRAIRQRTKDHIEGLERNINDLRSAHDASERMAAVANQRTRELEDENNYLRTKLVEVGFPMAVPPDSHRMAEQPLLTAHATSPSNQAQASIPRHESTSTPRSTLSINTSQSSGSRHGSWQQGVAQYPVTAASAPAGLPAHSSAQLGPGLTNWRSNDSVSSVHSAAEAHQLPPQPQYQNMHPADRQWGVAPQYPYHDPQQQQRPPTVPQPSPQSQAQYPPQPVPTYAPPHQQPPTNYIPPQDQFQSMTVQSPAAFPIPPQQQQHYPPQQQYAMAHMQVQPGAPPPPEYPGQIHPPQVVPAGYPASQPEQHYAQQPPMPQPGVQYRDDPGARGYSLTHYPTG